MIIFTSGAPGVRMPSVPPYSARVQHQFLLEFTELFAYIGIRDGSKTNRPLDCIAKPASEKMNSFLQAAIKEAQTGLRRNHGGPFGAVIVHEGRIIARAHNEVLKTNDPTAHAEIVAIRKASARLGRFDLGDCEIWSTCEPCPMCFAAIHWAKIPLLHYGCTHEDAAGIGFDDAYIYAVIRGQADELRLRMEQQGRGECLALFHEWRGKQDKQSY